MRLFANVPPECSPGALRFVQPLPGLIRLAVAAALILFVLASRRTAAPRGLTAGAGLAFWLVPRVGFEPTLDGF
jgi:hypothetical protein